MIRCGSDCLGEETGCSTTPDLVFFTTLILNNPTVYNAEKFFQLAGCTGG